jgi:hypothetical protein
MVTIHGREGGVCVGIVEGEERSSRGSEELRIESAVFRNPTSSGKYARQLVRMQ